MQAFTKRINFNVFLDHLDEMISIGGRRAVAVDVGNQRRSSLLEQFILVRN